MSGHNHNAEKKKGIKGFQAFAAHAILFQYRLINDLLGLLRRMLFKKGLPENPQHILLLRQGGLGDALVALPAVFAIREKFPSAQLDLLTHEPEGGGINISAIAPENTFSGVYWYSRFLDAENIRLLRLKHYDLFIELPSDKASFLFEIRSMLLARKLGISRGIGWAVSTHTFIRKLQEKTLSFFPVRLRLLHILSQYGILSKAEYPGFITKGENALAKHTEIKKTNRIGLIIGAGKERKVWPWQNFKAVGKYYEERGFEIVIIGGARESESAKAMLQQTGFRDFCGKLSFDETVRLIHSCSLVVSNDAGPLHIAYHVKTPIVAVYSGHTYSGIWYPPATAENKVLRNDQVKCLICFRNSCKENICMQSISVSDVIREADAILHPEGNTENKGTEKATEAQMAASEDILIRKD